MPPVNAWRRKARARACHPEEVGGTACAFRTAALLGLSPCLLGSFASSLVTGIHARTEPGATGAPAPGRLLLACRQGSRPRPVSALRPLRRGAGPRRARPRVRLRPRRTAPPRELCVRDAVLQSHARGALAGAGSLRVRLARSPVPSCASAPALGCPFVPASRRGFDLRLPNDE